jgi:hypothetical protein
MSYKSENWQDKLAEVRNSIVSKDGSVEKTADEIINEEIEAELKSFFAEEPVELEEIKQQEVDALKKLSKDMQAVLKGYQKIAKMGDKELANTKYNKDYEVVLKSRDTILQLIGKVNTQKILNKEEVEVIEEDLMVEMVNVNKLRELPDDVQKQIMSAKKEYDTAWSGVFVPMGDEGTSQRKFYEKQGQKFKDASKKYKALLTKHKVMTK